MEPCSQREVILEIEQIKLIRKRARTELRSCRGCSKATDFIRLTHAADLFSVPCTEVFHFATSHHCHFVVEGEGEIYICLAALLQAMSRKAKAGGYKLLETK